ncbi:MULTISPECIES: NUDIX hydrolase [unclassified Pantoea]|uniref:NUDIX hydrolase n=1 Tax=unclassified Pantoea TaxID=2630326 RepID=UPI001CD4D8BF|nr:MULTISPECIES: NUDIX hydrolase [unclassified Pantoea]MCA1178894.1 NUDIX hydrolase [Pantoea sp. alder69]MCA1253793.1 NUDIX hydrolase [Pantoea sp. alder70]MCA1267383.1 NUDIX hydrolase [Pantoea sp. alder81]
MNKVIFENSMLSVSVDELGYLKLLQKNGGVVIIPVYQNKYAIIQHSRNGEVLYEFPRGFIEPGETHLIGGERELKEELNLESSNSYVLGRLSTDSGLISDKIQAIICEVNDVSSLTPQKEEGVICCNFHSLEEIIGMIKEGLIKDNFTLAAFMLLIANNKK